MSNLTAGRELDALVAEQVMGEPCPPVLEGDDQWSEVFSRNHDGQLYTSPHGAWYAVCEYDQNDEVVWYPRPYSTSIAAAWEVVTHLRSQGYSLELNLWPEGDCTVIVHRMDVGAAEINQTDVPLAICWAALKAVGHE